MPNRFKEPVKRNPFIETTITYDKENNKWEVRVTDEKHLTKTVRRGKEQKTEKRHKSLTTINKSWFENLLDAAGYLDSCIAEKNGVEVSHSDEVFIRRFGTLIPWNIESTAVFVLEKAEWHAGKRNELYEFGPKTQRMFMNLYFEGPLGIRYVFNDVPITDIRYGLDVFEKEFIASGDSFTYQHLEDFNREAERIKQAAEKKNYKQPCEMHPDTFEPIFFGPKKLDELVFKPKGTVLTGIFIYRDEKSPGFRARITWSSEYGFENRLSGVSDDLGILGTPVFGSSVEAFEVAKSMPNEFEDATAMKDFIGEKLAEYS